MKSGVVLILGNSLLPDDSAPLRLVDTIKKHLPTIQCIHWDPTEELPYGVGDHLVVIDTIKGIDTVHVFTDLSAFTLSPRNTVHDFDVPVALTLLLKIGRLRNITILGIPYGINNDTMSDQLLTTLLSI